MRMALIHYRLLRKGGLETRLLNYIRYFTEKGHEVHLIVSKIDPSVVIPQQVTVHQINLKLVPKPIRMWFFNSGLAKVMKEEAFDFSLSLGRTSHQDMVLCPGSHLGYLEALNIKLWGPIDRMNIHLDKLAFRDSKLVLAASEKIQEEITRLAKVPAHKVKVLYPPTDASRFNQSGKQRREELRDKYGFSPSKKSLLFVTTGNHLKGYAFLLDVMAQLQDEPLELMVAGVKPMKTDLSNVKFLGYAEKVEELMWAADLLIHPAIYEAYAQVVSEALFCGLPVVISDKVGAKSVVTEEVGRVVQGFSKSDWADAIRSGLKKQWSIPVSFAKDNGLTVEQHCEQILQFASGLKRATP